MTRRKMRKLKREQSAERMAHREMPQLVATGRISDGVSVTYVPFRAMPSMDEIAATAVRKVIRALKT